MLLVRESIKDGKLYVINIVDSIVNADTLVDIYKIDEIVYEAKYRSTMEQITERFESKRSDYLLAYCGNKLIGYLTYLPVNGMCKDKILNDDCFNDCLIDSSHIPDNKSKDSSVYILSIAVLPEYRGLGLGLALSKELNKRLRYLNYVYGCSSVIATAINEKGIKVLENSGFKKLQVKPDKSCIMGRFITDDI